MNSISERFLGILNAMIKHGPFGVEPRNHLVFLERLTKVPAENWRNVLRGKQANPSHDMLAAVVDIHPQYAYWLMTGRVDLPRHTSPRNDVSPTDYPQSRSDILLKRDANGLAVVNIKHRLKLKTRHDLAMGLTSDDFEWSYFGAGPCELAANILFDSGLDERQSADLRSRFAREVLSSVPIEGGRLKRSEIQAWISLNT